VQALVVLVVVGFCAQLVDGALGMAYGATSSSLVLAAGVAPAVASASVHMAELGTTAVSGAAHWRFGNVDWRIVGLIGVPGAAGAFVGAVVLGSVPGDLAKPWMAGVLLALGAIVLARFALRAAPQAKAGAPLPRRALGPLGLCAGFVDATGGGGWGPVATPTLLATGRIEPRKVVGSVDTSEFVVALAASAGFLLALGRQGIHFGYVAALMIGGVVAAPLAAWLVQKLTARLLGTCVGGLILITNARTLVESFDVGGTMRPLLYLSLVALWATAVSWVVREHRRHGLPLLVRTARSAA
jgi:uncharacterized membrane protein YfcA